MAEVFDVPDAGACCRVISISYNRTLDEGGAPNRSTSTLNSNKSSSMLPAGQTSQRPPSIQTSACLVSPSPSGGLAALLLVPCFLLRPIRGEAGRGVRASACSSIASLAPGPALPQASSSSDPPAADRHGPPPLTRGWCRVRVSPSPSRATASVSRAGAAACACGPTTETDAAYALADRECD
jgi:hypothetical protein